MDEGKRFVGFIGTEASLKRVNFEWANHHFTYVLVDGLRVLWDLAPNTMAVDDDHVVDEIGLVPVQDRSGTSPYSSGEVWRNDVLGGIVGSAQPHRRDAYAFIPVPGSDWGASIDLREDGTYTLYYSYDMNIGENCYYPLHLVGGMDYYLVRRADYSVVSRATLIAGSRFHPVSWEVKPAPFRRYPGHLAFHSDYPALDTGFGASFDSMGTPYTRGVGWNDQVGIVLDRTDRTSVGWVSLDGLPRAFRAEDGWSSASSLLLDFGFGSVALGAPKNGRDIVFGMAKQFHGDWVPVLWRDGRIEALMGTSMMVPGRWGLTKNLDRPLVRGDHGGLLPVLFWHGLDWQGKPQTDTMSLPAGTDSGEILGYYRVDDPEIQAVAYGYSYRHVPGLPDDQQITFATEWYVRTGTVAGFDSRPYSVYTQPGRRGRVLDELSGEIVALNPPEGIIEPFGWGPYPRWKEWVWPSGVQGDGPGDEGAREFWITKPGLSSPCGGSDDDPFSRQRGIGEVYLPDSVESGQFFSLGVSSSEDALGPIVGTGEVTHNGHLVRPNGRFSISNGQRFLTYRTKEPRTVGFRITSGDREWNESVLLTPPKGFILEGKLSSLGLVAPIATIAPRLELWQGESLVATVPIGVDAEGGYFVHARLDDPPTGQVLLVVAADTHLRRLIGSATYEQGAWWERDIDLINGDCDGSDRVDLDDYFVLADAFRARVGDPRYDPRADLDRSGSVDLDDYFILADSFRSDSGTGSGEP